MSGIWDLEASREHERNNTPIYQVGLFELEPEKLIWFSEVDNNLAMLIDQAKEEVLRAWPTALLVTSVQSAWCQQTVKVDGLAVGIMVWKQVGKGLI